ncbi:23S rRNA (guanosine2251-2'-O)-methyltransferase [Thalassospira xiamenensis M-5 = DSM 17429]|uniref:RNA methyltransferase n=1 Tax=Thalassospira xiamenensis M-5 = DSM 17429 TaxID=1123366 RepID=A0AB72UAL9_9PROT|nr:23S rRNA (guanosine(2251)-2'-O)-methyltransferase RlmB [Thalassospira xiamenensis]AJD51303.1 RNA methyltransferase [Thalassospira xiamenensis M-5 = DSM 17429]SIT14723.1 23S rRNA (guanosine2251-2'-O)-methyltransferase [Thalassospira xiamenensis M-5 = DSM 17429]
MSRRNNSRSANRSTGTGPGDSFTQDDDKRDSNSRRGRKRGRDGGNASNASRLILFGRHPVLNAIYNPQRTIHKIWASEAVRDEIVAALADTERTDVQLDAAGRTDLDEMLPPGTVHQGMAMHCAPLPQISVEELIADTRDEEQCTVLILDQVTDPHNVGAILRSAAAFGAAAVIVPDRHAPPETGVLAKSASGALETVPYIHAGNLNHTIEKLKAAHFWLAGMDGYAEQTLAEAKLKGRVGIVMGSEGDGLRRLTRENCDFLVKLPMSDRIESLNVSNAAAVALYELYRTRG